MPVVKKGSKGDAVKALQRMLQQRGYLSGAIDGIFGPQTDRAVKAFQADNGLEVDGIAGEATWTTLEASQPFTGEATPAC